MNYDHQFKLRCRAIIAVLIALSFFSDATAQQSHSPAGIEAGQSSAAERTPSVGNPSSRYRLTPNDVVDLRFPYVPEFDQTVSVQPDGYVSLRVIGDLHVQGLTLPELRTLLVESYSGILRDPVINAVLRDFDKPYFIVAGEVVRPGKFDLRGATTVTQALAMAGGHTAVAKHSQVILFRQFTADSLEVKEVNVKRMLSAHDLSEDPLLRPGDTVFVPKNLISKIAPFIPRPGLGLYLNPFSP